MAPRVICVAGPTACGKTALGAALARHYGGEVVSADSMQIYRGMSVVSAAPTRAEMQGVPHHMIAVADPRASWSAGRYVREALPVVEEILARGRLPVIVGGTGLWMEALVRGDGFAPGAAGEPLRRQLHQRLEREGIGPLLEELRRVDPDSARRLPPGDARRILRALEVYYATGETITAHNAAGGRRPPRFEALTVGVDYADRAALHRAIDRRVEQMLRAGAAEEVRALSALGLPPEATARQAIGCRELLAFWEGRCTLEAAAEQIKLRTRQYAKRQRTWLRRRTDIYWILWEKEPVLSRALQLSTDFLSAAGLQ